MQVLFSKNLHENLIHHKSERFAAALQTLFTMLRKAKTSLLNPQSARHPFSCESAAKFSFFFFNKFSVTAFLRNKISTSAIYTWIQLVSCWVIFKHISFGLKKKLVCVRKQDEKKKRDKKKSTSINNKANVTGIFSASFLFRLYWIMFVYIFHGNPIQFVWSMTTL